MKCDKRLRPYKEYIWKRHVEGCSADQIADEIVQKAKLRPSIRWRLEVGRSIAASRHDTDKRKHPLGTVRKYLSMDLEKAVRKELIVLDHELEKRIFKRCEMTREGNWYEPYTVKDFAILACSMRLRFEHWGVKIGWLRQIQHELEIQGLIRSNPARVGRPVQCKYHRYIPTFEYTAEEYRNAS